MYFVKIVIIIAY